MFRRPMHPLRRVVRRAVLYPNQALLRAVTRANELLANGKHAQAAEIFERLAQEAEQRGQIKPAANAHAQAALAFVTAKNEQAALAHARMALAQFTQLNMAQRASAFFGNITQTLRDNEMASAAETLRQVFGDKVKTLRAQMGRASAQRSRLPSRCPHCAGPARSDEVEWIDEYSAECVYCGGVIQTEDEPS